jgi:LEA14-like dessication related protein
MKNDAPFAGKALVMAFAFGSALAVACAKPKAPQLTPQEVSITAIDTSGLDLRVKMDAFNPNGFAISVRSIAAHVVVNAQDLGSVAATQPINLPANSHTPLDVPMNVKWKGIGSVAVLAQARAPIPYTVDGTANIGGESLNVDVPFKMSGQISPAQLQQAVLKGLQGIPALQGLPLPGLAPH